MMLPKTAHMSETRTCSNKQWETKANKEDMMTLEKISEENNDFLS
jgi:hypothetical protein